MSDIKLKLDNYLIFVPLLTLVFFKAFISDLAYPGFEILYQNLIIFLAIITLFIYKKRDNTLGLPVTVIFLSLAISSFGSVNIYNSIKEIVKFASYISVFFMVSILSDSQKKILIKSIVIAASIISLYAIYQYFVGYPNTLAYLKAVNSDFLATSSYARDILVKKRAIGTFPSPNLLAGYLTMVFFLSLYLIKTGKKYWYVSTGLITAALILTKSLGAWLALIICLSVLLLRVYRSIKKKRLMVVSYFAIILLAMAFVILSRWEGIINLDDTQNPITQRLNYWKTAFLIIKEHPLLGIGAGNFHELFLKYKVGTGTDTKYAHNILLHQWAETGILGPTGILLLVVAFFKKTASGSKYIFLAGFSFALHNLIDISYFIPQSCYFWWIILALSP